MHKILSLKNVKEKKCLASCNLHGKEGRQNEKGDSSSFAELGSLVYLSCGQGIEIINLKMICSPQKLF
jgi:hypothetical protein